MLSFILLFRAYRDSRRTSFFKKKKYFLFGLTHRMSKLHILNTVQLQSRSFCFCFFFIFLLPFVLLCFFVLSRFYSFRGSFCSTRRDFFRSFSFANFFLFFSFSLRLLPFAVSLPVRAASLFSFARVTPRLSYLHVGNV